MYTRVLQEKLCVRVSVEHSGCDITMISVLGTVDGLGQRLAERDLPSGTGRVCTLKCREIGGRGFHPQRDNSYILLCHPAQSRSI